MPDELTRATNPSAGGTRGVLRNLDIEQFGIGFDIVEPTGGLDRLVPANRRYGELQSPELHLKLEFICFIDAFLFHIKQKFIC